MLRARVDRELSRSAALRVHEASDGNPFYALELARAVTAAGGLDASGTLPVPDRLGELLSRRLAELPRAAAPVLAVAAILSRPTRAALRCVPGRRGRGGRRRRRRRRGGPCRARTRPRLAHPLLAAAAEAGVGTGERRELHRRAADAASGTEERLRHLAVVAEGPDPALAAALDEAADATGRRGAAYAAAQLAELAVAVSPSGNDRVLRQLRHTRLLVRAGDGGRAAELLERLARDCPAGPARAEALMQLSSLVPVRRGVSILEQARDEAAGVPALLAEVRNHLATAIGVSGDAAAWQIELEAAAELAREAGAEGVLARALSMLGVARALRGGGPQRELMGRAAALAEQRHDVPAYEHPSLWLGMQLMFADELDEGRVWMEDALRRAVEDGDVDSECGVYLHLIDLEVRAGALQSAERYATGRARRGGGSGRRG